MVAVIFLNTYKEVNEDYVNFPTANEKVKFTGTYLGPYDGIYNLDGESGVIQVGSSYVIVSNLKLQGLEGQSVTVEGYFVNDKVDKDTVHINGKYVSGENFCIKKVV